MRILLIMIHGVFTGLTSIFVIPTTTILLLGPDGVSIALLAGISWLILNYYFFEKVLRGD